MCNLHDYENYWETKDGQLIKYSNMSDRHLLNAHDMLSRKVARWVNKCMSQNLELNLPEWVEITIDKLEEELSVRGLLNE